MNFYSDEEYFYKLDNMVIQSTKFLREILKQRWESESGEEWKDEPNYIQLFLNQHCKNVIKNAIPLQVKVLFASCSLEEWDISLLSLVLLNFGDKKKYEIENQAVRQLKKLRNDLAHHKSKKLTQSEYCEKLKMLKDSLQMLGIEKSNVAKFVNGSNTNSSLEDDEHLSKLLKNADQLIKSRDFESALKQYSEAITIPRLSKISLGMVYEKRAACHLSIKNGKHTDQALIDIEHALKFNKSSWNAHYLKAKCHKAKNNLPKAIQHFEMALAISPIQKQIKQELDSCKLLNLSKTHNAHLNRDQLPSSVSEILGDFKNEPGHQLSLKNVFQLNGSQAHPVYLGERHYYGYETPINYTKAVKYFTQADKEEFALGTYKLGLCYYRGHGVPQDVGKAIEIYRRCAKMNARKREKFENVSPLGFNQGVCHAENAIGKCYEQGTGVEKSWDHAAMWYRKAMEHGHGAGATNLGILYMNGDGVPQNEKMAEMCWKQGLNLKNTVAAEYLMDYYRHELEPEMAWIMLQIAREMGHTKYLEMSDEEFNRDLTWFQSDRCRLEKFVTEFEQQQNIDFKGMTFKQRMVRFQQHTDPNIAKINNISPNKAHGGQIQNIGKNVMMEVALKSLEGSKTAFEVLETINSIFELNDLLLMSAPNGFPKQLKLRVVNLAYDVLMLQDHLKLFIKNITKFQNILEELFNETCHEKGEEEMKIRLCYVGYNLWSSLKSPDDLYAYGILEEGIRRYPDNYGYVYLQICCLKRRELHKKALKCVNEAIERFPEKADLYSIKAKIILNGENMKWSEVIAAFKLFIEKAPRDHRLVPEAYYEISFAYMEDYGNHETGNEPEYMNNEIINLIQENFRFGKDAEKDQLPCYQPYAVSDVQSIVEGFLGRLQEKRNAVSLLENKTLMPYVPQFKSLLDRKEYLKSPLRKGLILQHRERLREGLKFDLESLQFVGRVVPGMLKQKRAKKMAMLKPITLQEMNPAKDRIYENRILELTIIDEPNIYHNTIQLVAEDDNGDTTRVFVDVDTVENVILERFVAGSRIAVINPCMWIAPVGGINGIRINEYKCMMHLEGANGFCRFCGEENATRKCSHCKRLYCSRECQKLDWQMFEHKLICSLDDEKYCGKSIQF